MSSKYTLNAVFKPLIALATVAVLSACGGNSGDGDPVDGGVVVTEITLPAARKTLPSLATYNSTFEGEHHSGSGECASCHTDVSMNVESDVPGERRDVSIGTAWETSVMAQATRDPYWHAVVASELDNFPMLEDTINDKCLVCHAPTAYDLAQKEGLDLRLFDKVDEQTNEVLQQGIYTMDNSNELFNHAMDGVTCTLCHQMDGTNFGTEESMTGGYVINGSPTGDISDRPAYGQYQDPEIAYMKNNSNFTPQHGPHISTSESCATCHNLNIEPVDPQGNKIPEIEHFAEQAIYTEWLKSDYAVGGAKEASCQDCHMPKVSEDVPIAQGANQIRPDFAEHTFLGANTVMQDMFKNFATELGIDPDLDFDAAIARNREFLKTSATVTVTEGQAESGQLNFDVAIQNNTGHKLPAGYHSRRVYLHVQVLKDSELVFESGKMQPNGLIVGVSEDVNPDVYEPHYDIITNETQVQVYQTIVSDVNGERTHSLLSGSGYLKDNRITPSGFDKFAIANDTSLPSSFGVFGNAMDNDANFNDGRDTVKYRLNLNELDIPEGGVFTVVADLRYQPLSYGHLQKLWIQGDRVDQIDMFRTMYEDEKTDFLDEFIATDTLLMQ